MVVKTERLYGKNQTGRRMYDLIRSTAGDLDDIFINGVSASDLPLAKWYTIVKRIPYRIDPVPREIIARPAILAKYGPQVGIDCKKKSCLMAAALERKKIPWRLMSTSRRPDKKVSHVFPQAFLVNRWVNLDATYPFYRPGQPKQVTKAEILKG